MNFRVTALLFGLLMITLWVFGLMIAHRKAAGEPGVVVPSLREDAKIDKLLVKHKMGEKSEKEVEDVFESSGDRWFLVKDKEKVRVEGFRIEGIIREIRDAKHDETANVEGVRIDNPQITVTLFGKAKDEPKEWKFYVGKENFGLVYVASSENEGKVFAVPKRSLDNLFFTNANNFRYKLPFDFVDTAVSNVLLKKDGNEVELKRGEANMWSFVTPRLGLVGFETEAPPPPKNPHELKPKAPPPATGGVKALLADIRKIHVENEDDFEPLGSPVGRYGLEKGKEAMKIEVVTGGDKGEKKESSSEIMLIGLQNKERKGKYYFARMADDDGVFQINAEFLEPIDKVLKDPGKIRSLDIAVFDEAKVDAIALQVGKEEFQFFKAEAKEKEEPLPFKMPGQKEWEMYIGKEKKKASDGAIHTLLEQVQGKKAIVEFLDAAPGAEEKKKDAEWGFDNPVATVAVYQDAIEQPKKEEAKDEKEKKDDKEKKDEKKEAGKKDEKKEGPPALKKDAKPVVKLEFGKSDKETINVKRTLQDGTVSRFTVKKELYDKIVPEQGPALAYLELDLPEFPGRAVTAVTLERRTDKGTETIDLERLPGEPEPLWYVKDPLEPGGLKLAETSLVDSMVRGIANMRAKKWVKRIEEKEDLEKYGLKTPAAVIKLVVKKDPATPASAAAAVAVLAGDSPLLAAAFVIGARQADKGEIVTVSLGKETDEGKSVYAMHSGVKLLFLLPAQFLKEVRDSDFRDRAILMTVQGRMIASMIANAGTLPIELLMLDSPYVSGQIFNLDPDKIKQIRIEERTPFELRSFDFQRDPKDKSWIDKSNIPEFRIDADKVTQFAKEIAKLKAERFVAVVGGPRGEHKLGLKQAAVKLDLVMDDGRAITLLVGANFLNQGYYATTSIWPETVFMLAPAAVEPMLRGAPQFAKERLVGVE